MYYLHTNTWVENMMNFIYKTAYRVCFLVQQIMKNMKKDKQVPLIFYAILKFLKFNFLLFLDIHKFSYLVLV